MSKKNWLEESLKKKGYQGCRNCKYQPEPLRMCDWGEKETIVHVVCPRWEKKNE